ncbi:hypothetical protein [Brazilian marseillevirus]|uniref:hypothetical protein n=1 Tax=Brazilian marseillevirus TaxID=1813599 RepID=UPI000781CFC5|nr:hypothetical protein A3303_gp382 [Brazilian marseillevirus]AMQ10890.1 hypothetical protein [Brazilian marseillevirus]
MSDRKTLLKKEQKAKKSFVFFRATPHEKESRLLRILKLRERTVSKSEHGTIILDILQETVNIPGCLSNRKVKVTKANDEKVWLKGKDEYGRRFELCYKLGKTKFFYKMQRQDFVW